MPVRIIPTNFEHTLFKLDASAPVRAWSFARFQRFERLGNKNQSFLTEERFIILHGNKLVAFVGKDNRHRFVVLLVRAPGECDGQAVVGLFPGADLDNRLFIICLLYTSPSPRD